MVRRSDTTLSRNGQRKLGGRNTFSMDLDTSGLKQYLQQLDDGVKEAIRPAAQAAAQVVYDRVKLNVQGIGKVTGNLDRSIYQAFSPEKSKTGQRAEYHISWNHKKAPHGHLLEYGWTQRYVAVTNKRGQWVTLVRPEKVGTPKPKRRASLAEKDAYYVLRPGGPKQHPATAFMRSASSAMPAALAAAQDTLIARIKKG